MTSSARQTEPNGRPWAARFRGRLDLATMAALVLAGWISIAAVNRWHVGPPVIFLGLGWLAICLCGWFFWRSASAAAAEGTAAESEGFELTAGRVAELEKEKRALLKAIKEVEFDREMGKMSEEDAADISRVYRARAIEVLKELEGDEGGTAVSNGAIDHVVDREVRARLALAGVAARKSARAAEAKTARSEPAEAVAEGSDPGSPPSTEPEKREDA